MTSEIFSHAASAVPALTDYTTVTPMRVFLRGIWQRGNGHVMIFHLRIHNRLFLRNPTKFTTLDYLLLKIPTLEVGLKLYLLMMRRS